jgi:hypothetical protein
MATKSQYPTKTITHLFWGKYSFKIVVSMKTTYSNWWDAAKRSKELVTVLKHCPDEEVKSWRYISNYDNVVVFFEHQDDFDHFIEKFKGNIREVWKPLSEKQTELHNDDHKLVVREKLFYGKFDWCVTLQLCDRMVRDEIRDWTAGFFEVEEGPLVNDRLHYSDGRHIKLYLCDESDVLMVKLAQSGRIRKIEKVVLTETLITETP